MSVIQSLFSTRFRQINRIDKELILVSVCLGESQGILIVILYTVIAWDVFVKNLANCSLQLCMAFNIHVLRPEAEGAILSTTVECAQNLKNMWEGSRCPCSHVSAGSLSFRKCAGVKMFESSTALCARQCHGLHECKRILLLHSIYASI